MPKLPYLCLRLLARFVMYSTSQGGLENYMPPSPTENELIFTEEVDGNRDCDWHKEI